MQRYDKNQMENTLPDERKAAEVMRSRLAAIVESSDDAIIAKDLNGIITAWNGSAERIFGYTESEVLGKPITIIIP
jgi:PAS domain S-box-containing protein